MPYHNSTGHTFAIFTPWLNVATIPLVFSDVVCPVWSWLKMINYQRSMLPVLYCCQDAKPSPTHIRPRSAPPLPVLAICLVLSPAPFISFLSLTPSYLRYQFPEFPWQNRPPTTRETIAATAGIHQPCAFWHVPAQRHDDPHAHFLGFSKRREKTCARDVMCKVELESLLVSIESQLFINLPKHGSATGIKCASPVLCQRRLWCDSTQHPVYVNVLSYYSPISFTRNRFLLWLHSIRFFDELPLMVTHRAAWLPK